MQRHDVELKACDEIWLLAAAPSLPSLHLRPHHAHGLDAIQRHPLQLALDAFVIEVLERFVKMDDVEPTVLHVVPLWIPQRALTNVVPLVTRKPARRVQLHEPVEFAVEQRLRRPARKGQKSSAQHLRHPLVANGEEGMTGADAHIAEAFVILEIAGMKCPWSHSHARGGPARHEDIAADSAFVALVDFFTKHRLEDDIRHVSVCLTIQVARVVLVEDWPRSHLATVDQGIGLRVDRAEVRLTNLAEGHKRMGLVFVARILVDIDQGETTTTHTCRESITIDHVELRMAATLDVAVEPTEKSDMTKSRPKMSKQ